MQASADDNSNLRYHVCVRCNKRHTHKRFQGKKPHTDVPADWKEVIGLYTNKHTGKPIAQKASSASPIMCHSCHKQYVNRCNKRAAPSSCDGDYQNAKRPCRHNSPPVADSKFEHVIDVFLYLSDSRPALQPLPVASSS